jgi:type III secretion system HrpE/YscL family protein
MSPCAILRSPSNDLPRRLLLGTRLPRSSLLALQRSDALLHTAQAEADALREQTRVDSAQALQAARAQGLSEGRLEAMAALLTGLTLEQRLRELLSDRLADIVVHCICTVLGDMGESVLLRQRVLELLRSSPEVARGTPLEGATLSVCPAQLPLVQAILSEPGSGLSGLRVVSDPHRAPDALLLETPRGFAQSELELTLQQTRTLVHRAAALALRMLGESP